MTKEVFNQLSTGDFVKNVKTDEAFMITIVSQPLPAIATMESLMSVMEDLELTKSRTTVTKDEMTRIEEYHRKIKEAQEGKR